MDARLTRLEDAVAALTRKRALEEKADAERTAAAATAAAATRSRSRGFVAGLAGMGIGETFSPFGFDPLDAERERVRAVATSRGRRGARVAFAAARCAGGTRRRRAEAAAGCRQPPMGSLP